MGEFTLGLDLGQAQDYTALAILERVRVSGEVVEHHLRDLRRFPLGTPYPRLVEEVAQLMEHPRIRGRTTLVVDATGVGAAVLDMLRSRGLAPVPVWITAGERAEQAGDGWRVPKRDLVAVVQVLLQTGRLKLAAELVEVATLTQELRAFGVKFTPSGRDAYGVWREGQHDDLVLALALACWWSERGGASAQEFVDFYAQVVEREMQVRLSAAERLARAQRRLP
jgi:hypothetical protein